MFVVEYFMFFMLLCYYYVSLRTDQIKLSLTKAFSGIDGSVLYNM